MDINEKLEKCLNDYIEQNNKNLELFNRQKNLLILYEELLNQMNKIDCLEKDFLLISILLDDIYGNTDYSNEIRMLLNNKDFDKISEIVVLIEKDYLKLKEKQKKLYQQISRNKNRVLSAKKIELLLRKNIFLLDKELNLSNIIQIIKSYEINGLLSVEDSKLILDKLLSYNIDKNKNDFFDNIDNLFDSINSLSSFHDKIEVSNNRKNTLNSFAFDIVSMIDVIDKNELIDHVKQYQRFNILENEYNYLIMMILNYLLDELKILYELLIDSLTYSYNNDIKNVINLYSITSDKYFELLNYYKNLNSQFVKSEYDMKIDNNKSNKLIYSCSNNNINDVNIFSDMKNISSTYYNKIYNLLLKFKNGELKNKNIKILMGDDSKYRNLILRDDEIRIIIKQIKDDIYIVLGVFVKNNDNINIIYKRMLNRMIPDITVKGELDRQEKLSMLIEEELEVIVNSSCVRKR